MSVAVDLHHVVCAVCFELGDAETALCGTPLAGMEFGGEADIPECIVCYSTPIMPCNNCGTEIIT